MSEYKFPKKLLVYMTFDEQKIQEMIDKQISKFIKLYNKHSHFTIEYRKQYPEKWNYLSKNMDKIYKLFILIDRKREHICKKEYIDNFDLYPIAEFNNISEESFYKIISELLQVDNPEYWYDLIKNSYKIDINDNIVDCKQPIILNNDYKYKYEEYCAIGGIPNEILSKFIAHIKFMHKRETIKKIIKNPYGSETINIFHNYNYLNILCKFFLKLGDNYHRKIPDLSRKYLYYDSKEAILYPKENAFGIKVYELKYTYSPFLQAPYNNSCRPATKIIYEDRKGFLENVRKIIFNN